jgi:hypothetical protein
MHHIYYSRSGTTDLKTAVLLSYRLMINYSGMQPTAVRLTAAERPTSVHDKHSLMCPDHRTIRIHGEQFKPWHSCFISRNLRMRRANAFRKERNVKKLMSQFIPEKQVVFTQNYCFFLYFPSSDVLENRKHVSETGSVFVLRSDRSCPVK